MIDDVVFALEGQVVEDLAARQEPYSFWESVDQLDHLFGIDGCVVIEAEPEGILHPADLLYLQFLRPEPELRKP